MQESDEDSWKATSKVKDNKYVRISKAIKTDSETHGSECETVDRTWVEDKPPSLLKIEKPKKSPIFVPKVDW